MASREEVQAEAIAILRNLIPTLNEIQHKLLYEAPDLDMGDLSRLVQQLSCIEAQFNPAVRHMISLPDYRAPELKIERCPVCGKVTAPGV